LSQPFPHLSRLISPHVSTTSIPTDDPPIVHAQVINDDPEIDLTEPATATASMVGANGKTDSAPPATNPVFVPQSGAATTTPAPTTTTTTTTYTVAPPTGGLHPGGSGGGFGRYVSTCIFYLFSVHYI
jgi:hypothetical protein